MNDNRNPNRRPNPSSGQRPRQNPYPNQNSPQNQSRNPYSQGTPQPPHSQNPYGNPYAQYPPPDPAYLRRRQEVERKQAEARRQAQRDRERREKQRQKAERERRIREGLRILGGRLLVFAVILLILCLLTGLLFLFFFQRTPDEPDTSGKITYTCGGRETRRTPVEEALADGTVSVCFNDIADYLGMMESGTAQAMKFILPMSDTVPETSGGLGNEEVICFYIDSQQADINGQTVRLDIPNRIRGTEVWVSASFVTEYMNNLSLQYNEKKGVVSISRIVDEENSTEDVTVYLPVSFKLKDIDALDPLPEDSTAEETDESSETDDLLTLPEEKPVSAPAEETDESSQTDDLLTLPEDKPVSAPAEETDESSQTDDLLTLPEDKPVSAPAEEDELPYTMDELNFQTDLTEYEPYMEPADRDAYLRLVNPTHLIEESELPNDLVDCIYTAAARSTQTLRLSAARALEALFLEMKAAGFDGMEVYSGYRSIEYQSVLFERYTQNELAKNPSLTREEAEKIVLTYSTRPGTSEHHTGLAVDMDTLGTFSTDFAYTPEYAWLSENAWKFGFILRFPADKTEITTIQFEPWHYRFVGRYHAKKIHDAGVCLEEYVELLSAGI